MIGRPRSAILFSLLALLGSCTCHGGKAGAPLDADGGEPRRGGVLVMADTEIPTSFDPLGTLDANPSIFAVLHVFDQLVRASKDGKGVEPDLAESWTISPDGRVYTFRLRPNLRFSDGSKLGASDVKFSLDRRAAEDKGTSQTLFPKLEISAPDDRTVVLALESPWSPLLTDLALYAASVIPEKYFKEVGHERFASAPLGSGPFVLADYKRGESFVLKRNPTYWDARYPYLDEIRHVGIADDATRMLKIQAGEVDVAEVVPFNQVDALDHAPGVAVRLDPILGLDILCMNQRLAPLKDRKARQALAAAIDRAAISKVIYFGHADVPRGLLPPFADVNAKGPPFAFDLSSAQKLLAESASPKGFALSLLIVGSDSNRQMASLIQAELKPLGIQVEIQQAEPALYWERLQRGDFGLALTGATSDIADPSEVSDLAVHGVIAGWMAYSEPATQALAAKANLEMDALLRTNLYRELEQRLRDEAPYVALSWSPMRTALRRDVHGFAILPTANYRLWEVWKSL